MIELLHLQVRHFGATGVKVVRVGSLDVDIPAHTAWRGGEEEEKKQGAEELTKLTA